MARAYSCYIYHAHVHHVIDMCLCVCTKAQKTKTFNANQVAIQNKAHDCHRVSRAPVQGRQIIHTETKQVPCAIVQAKAAISEKATITTATRAKTTSIKKTSETQARSFLINDNRAIMSDSDTTRHRSHSLGVLLCCHCVHVRMYVSY